jgi:intracellular septation protein
MTQALRQLGEDFLSAILFFAVYATTDSLPAAVAIAVATGLLQTVQKKLARKPVETMQWLSLGLVVVLGAATLLAASPRLMMLKPSIVHLAVAAVMLRHGWMSRYLPPIARQNLPERVIVAAGYAWAALMVLLAAANLVVALNVDIATWAWFVASVLLGAKIAAVFAQYLVFRMIVRRRLLVAATG